MLLVAIVYRPTRDNGYIWDDDQHVHRTAVLGSPAGLRRIWFTIGATPQYYPLVHSTFWVESQLWGLDPRGYHLDNLALHAAAALLAWRLLVRLAVPGAWFAAAIFAVHPVGVESVAWIAERKNVLSCALVLGSLLAYLRFSPAEVASAPADTSRPSGGGRYYALALVLFVAALLSKTVTACAPAVILVIFWWKRGRVSWRDVLPLVPFFAIGLALGSMTVWLELTHVGAFGDEWDLAPSARLLVAGCAVWFYAAKLLWPDPLIFFYPRWEIDIHVWWQHLFPAAAVAVIIGLWLARGRLGRGPLAAILIFVGVLMPALGFFNVYPFRYSFVADHFQYHASIALIALMSAALVGSGRRLLRRNAWLPPLLGAAILLPLAVVAEHRTRVYKSEATLYEDTIAADPLCWVAQQNLGGVLYRQGHYDDAIMHIRAAVALREAMVAAHPTLLAYQEQLAANYVNLALALAKIGQPTEALSARHRAIELREALTKSDPAAGPLRDTGSLRDTVAGAYLEVALVEHELGRSADAAASLSRALAMRQDLVHDFPESPTFQDSLAVTYTDLAKFQHADGQLPAAKASSTQAVRILTALVRDYPDVTEYQTHLRAAQAQVTALESESARPAH